MKVIRIKIDGTMDELDVKNNDIKKISKSLESLSISKGSSSFKKLYEWNHQNKKYECYGWFDGESGFENKHDLLPNGISSFLEEDSSEILLFGDIFILMLENKKYINLEVSHYGEIFGILCGGYDECESDDYSDEDDISETPNSEDESFIVGDEEYITTDDSYSGEEELDIDENSYTDESDD
jgi:hypothetical protein